MSKRRKLLCAPEPAAPNHEPAKRHLSPRENADADRLMRAGYLLANEREFGKACEVWLSLWDRFKEALRSRGIRGVHWYDASGDGPPGRPPGPDDIFEGEEFFFNWCQDLEEALGNASRVEDPSWWPRALRYCEDFQDVLPLSDEDILVNMGTLEAQALNGLGRFEEAEARLETLTQRHPGSAWAWTCWGDRWAGEADWGGPHDSGRARAIYERGLAASGDDDPDMLRERLEALRDRGRGSSLGFGADTT